MEAVKAAVLVVAGAVGALSGSALLREAPGAKTYFVHHLDVDQAVDGTVTTRACSDATLALKDGGSSTVDLGCIPCPIVKADSDALKAILSTATSCAANAP